MKKRATKFEPGRITMLRELLQMSQVKFANKIRISQGALSQIENGKSQISFDTLRNLSNELNVNCNWVVNGVGKIFYQKTEEEADRTLENHALNITSGDFDAIPLVKEEAHAGYIDGFENPDYLKTLNKYQVPGYENGSYRLFEVEGESMVPTLNPHEIVIAEYLEDKALENGTLCILITRDGIIAKRGYYNENNKKLLILKSDNSRFKSYSVERKKILEMWKIKGKITSVFIETSLIDAKRMEKLENDLEMLKNEVKELAKQ